MKVIISGCNRMEFCNVKKKKDFDRRFFMTRGQLYSVFPHALVRMRVYTYGKERDTEAVIAYKENEIIPYDTKDIEYSMDNFLADIDRYKQMTDYSWLKGNKPWFKNETISKAWAFLTSGTGIAVIVLAWIFLTGGMK